MNTMPQGKRNNATIIDVADMAGVSISTVSRVINKQGGVSVKLEKRISDAIETLNYRPNTVARALKSKMTRLIGLIIPSISNPIFSQLAKFYEEESEKYGYSLILSSSDSSLEKETECLYNMIQHQVDGIVFNGLGLYDERFEIVKDRKVPIVFIGRRMEEFQCDNVTLNNRRGAYIAVKHLIENGATKIGFIFGKHESVSATEDRFAGYRDALNDHGLKYDERIVVRTNNSCDDGGRYAINKLLSTSSDLDAIFVSNDLMALGCMEQLRLSGKRVPQDIAVMGYDGIPYGRMMVPSLSTMVTPCREMASMAISTIVQRIENNETPYKEVVFETVLYHGGSTSKNG